MTASAELQLVIHGIFVVVFLLEPLSGDGLPVVSGLLARLPPGVACGRVVTLEDGGGQTMPAVFERHRNGYTMHAILPPAGGRTRRLRVLGRAGTVRWPELSVAVSAKGGVVTNGTQTWELLPGGVVRSGSSYFGTWPPTAPDGSWRILACNPLRAVLVYEGVLAAPGAGQTVRCEQAVELHAGTRRWRLHIHASARLDTRLRDGLGMRMTCRDGLGLRGAGERPLRALARSVIGRRADGGWTVDGRSWQPTGETWLDVDATPPLAVACRRAFPLRGFRLEHGGEALVLLCEGAGVRLERGEGRFLRFSLGQPGADPLQEPLVLPRKLLRRAGGGTALELRRLPAGVAAATDPLISAWLRDERHGLDLEGRDAGDWHMNRETVGNLEYDTVLGLLLRALRTRSVRVYAAAMTCLDHLLSRDRDAAGTGFFIPHGDGHRGAAPEAGHHWIDGVLLAEHWTRDPLVCLETERLLVQQLQSSGVLALEEQLPRSLGWGLRALSSGAACSPDKAAYRREVRRWRRHLLTRQDSRGALCLVRQGRRAGIHLLNPFVQGGIVAPALARSLRVCPSGSVARRTRRLVVFLARHSIGRHQNVPYLVRRLQYDRYAGEVTERWGQAEGEHAALFLAGVTRAHPALRRDAGLRRLRLALGDQLRASRKRFTGREVSLLMRSLPGLVGW